MDDAAKWGFICTMFGILVTGIVELVKSFKDGAVTRATKEDTADMKPKVDDIKTAVSTTNAILQDAVKPTIQNMNEQTRKIDTVVNTMAHFEGLVQGSRSNALRPDELLAQMRAVYDERHELILENQELKKEIERLKYKNLELEQRIDELEPEPPVKRNGRVR